MTSSSPSPHAKLTVNVVPACDAALTVNVVPACGDRMLKLFAYGHLPPQLQAASQPFFALAHDIVDTVPAGPERTVGLRKLLEAKDAIVRAVAIPE
jgi:hypothetical protein